MALNTTTLETNLNTKMNATTGTTEGKEFLLLGKAVEALTPSITVASVIAEGTTQIGLVNTAGTTQVGLVNTEGSTQVAAVQAAASGYAPLADPTFTGTVNAAALTLSGNLTVNGTTTTVNSTTLDVADLNITIADGAADAAAANGAGITVDGASANITYTSATDTWDFNKAITGTYTNLQPKQTASSVTSSHVVNMNEPLHIITMTGATNFTFSNVAEGKITMIKLYAPSSTPPAFGSDTKWPAATEPTWSDHDYWLISVVAHSSSVTLASASGFTV
jgi:hypothetical protein